jgi:hypothetical protein
MKSSWLFFLVFVAASTCEVNASPSPPLRGHHDRSISNLSELDVQTGVEIPADGRMNLRKREEDEEVTVVNRCRAQELSPGAALGIMVVLATGSAVHMPGSVVIPKRGCLYRLAPELGILEAMVVLWMVGKGLFKYQKSLKISVMATLSLRYFQAENDLWWQNDDCDPSSPNSSTAANCYDSLEPFFDQIRQFGHNRLLGDGLMILAITKAFAVKGTIRTILLAASYGLSFFTIELLSLAALHLGPPKTRAQFETEALKCTELITLLDNSDNAWEHRVSPQWQDPEGDSLRFTVSVFIVGALFGLASALHLIFWPFSVPLFLLFDFVERHTGGWIFRYSTFLQWAFWMAVAAAGLSLLAIFPALLLWKFPEKRNKYLELCRRLLGHLFNNTLLLFDAYALLKFALIARFYISSYTGQGTTTPVWLDWLG